MAGISVSKTNLYAAIAPFAGLSVSKTNLYAIVGPGFPFTGVGVAKTSLYAIVIPDAPQRGNIDFDQIRSVARQGHGPKFQMQDGGAVTPGNVPVYNAWGDLTDSGAAPAGFNGLILPVRIISAGTTLMTTDYCTVITAVCTITLPAIPSTGQSFQIKNGMTTPGNTVIVSGTIDGASSVTLNPLASVSLIYDGTMWRQI